MTNNYKYWLMSIKCTLLLFILPEQNLGLFTVLYSVCVWKKNECFLIKKKFKNIISQKMVFHANVKFKNFKLRIYDNFCKNWHTELKLYHFSQNQKIFAEK